MGIFRVLCGVWVLSFVVLAALGAEASANDGERRPSFKELSTANSFGLISQADPSQDRFPDLDLSPEPLEPSSPEEEVTPPASEDTPAPSDNTLERLEIRQIEVVGSTVFDDQELMQVIAEQLGTVAQSDEPLNLTVEELQDVADAITGHYLKSGYITSRAIVPEQTIADGVIQIQVIEGSLEEIQIAGTERLAAYAHSRVALAGKTPVNSIRIEEQLRLLKTDPLFDEVTADLAPGTAVGQSLLIVTVTEAAPLQGSLSFDTLSPLSVGRYRGGARLEYLNLLGLGDRLSTAANVTTTGGSEAYEIAYQVPLNPMNGTILLRVAPSDFRITNRSATPSRLDASGSTEIYEASIRQPLIRSLREEFALSAGLRYREGSSVVAGNVTPSIRTSVVSLGQDYLKRDTQGAWALQSQFRIGTDLFDATDTNDSFFVWAGQAQRSQVINPKHLLVFQTNWQITDDRLPGSEQFFLGGPSSVRGYFQNEQFGDSGFRFSVSDYITLQRNQDNNAVLQLVPFVDLAYAWFSDDDVQDALGDDNFLLSTGIGLVVNPVEGLSASVDLGVPLVSTDESPDILVDFNLRYRF
ncbi:MAG: ShlB/FhaC/HecB family hemolysin secretion/activation protein [Cyanobacteria bacterium P01_D01_bin.156]